MAFGFVVLRIVGHCLLLLVMAFCDFCLAGSVVTVIAALQRINASCTGVRFVFLICVLV